MNSANDISIFINAIRELCHVGICYYDLSKFFRYNTEGVKQNRGHYCAFCEKARTLPCGRENCNKSDKAEAVRLAKEYREPFFFECHMGMKELVIPALRENELIGILFVGQCRIAGDNYENTILKNARRFGGNGEEMLRLYEQLPLLSQNDLRNIGKLLSGYFRAQILNNQLLSPAIVEADSQKNPAAMMRGYIDANYCYQISPNSIARRFFVNPSYASRCFRQKYGVTLTEYIGRVRMERAKVLLRSTSAPINSIALNVGYTDPNYFSRTFKKQVGMTASAYRTARQKDDKK